MTNEFSADVLTDLIGVLGDVLRVKPEKIDPEQTFPSMGLDSLLVVEFVAVVNSRYGLRVLATDLYDFPTPASFARELARAANSEPAARVPAPGPAPTAFPVLAAPLPVSAPTRQAPAAATAPRVAELLREQLAGILCCDPWDINPTAAFNVLGVDSIVGAEFIAVVNRAFGLQERSVLLYEHPNLAAMAAYIATRTGATAQDFAPAAAATVASPRATLVQATEPRFRPAARPAPAVLSPAVLAPAAPAPTTAAAAAARTLPGGDLDVLLDAIRDDRLTVDEALVLLARRG
ncbi:phosphopantetheine-binding protein [Streptomyces sp. NPDC087917]|uniref:phosphopantetheine-binding protein n=1 Tax=unclassified Streptomyces TaxID=2593676 RepID=UPI003441EA39